MIVENAPLPTYVVIPSRDIVSRYMREFPMNRRNWDELLTQVFEWFMETGLTTWHHHHLATDMFSPEPVFAEKSITHIAERLYHELRMRLKQCVYSGFMPLDGGDAQHFNYAYHELRGADIVVKHLSDDPNYSRRNL